MVKTFLVLLTGLFFIFGTLFLADAQVLPLDSTSYRQWTKVDWGQLSADCRYAGYILSNRALNHDTLIITSLKQKWQLNTVVSNTNFQFTADGKYVIYQNKDQEVVVQELGANLERKTPPVASFTLMNDVLLCTLTDSAKTLMLIKPGTNKINKFSHIQSFLLSADKSVLLINRIGKEANEIYWLDPEKPDELHLIRKQKEISGLTFNKNGTLLAYVIVDSAKRTLWCYDRIGNVSRKLVGSNTSGLMPGTEVSGPVKFTSDGAHLYFNLRNKAIDEGQSKHGAAVNIWSYTDQIAQSQQLTSLNDNKDRLAVTATKKDEGVITLEDAPTGTRRVIQSNDHTAIISERSPERWANAESTRIYAVDINSRVRKEIDDQEAAWDILTTGELSPDGKSLAYYNKKKKCLSVLDIASGTSHILMYHGGDYILHSSFWIDNKQLWVDDQFDCWIVSLHQNKPYCLTQGYGQIGHTQFRIADLRIEGEYVDAASCFKLKQPLVLTAFNYDTKENGFFTIVPGKTGSLKKLTMGPYVYHAPEAPSIYDCGPAPVQSKDGQGWLVRRMDARHSPNYYFTNDLKSFRQISDIAPESSYNWPVTELINYRTSDNQACQGVLYKPRNFNPKIKYPVIFHYYDISSNNLNVYIPSGPFNGVIDIASVVSRGYLVFTPDIHFSGNNPGECAYRSVMGAAAALAKFPFVDSRHLGLHGHSFGGYETDYIVTKTHLFAAAYAGAAVSDIVSSYDQIRSDPGTVNNAYYEFGQGRIGYPLFEKPDLYIAASPIFHAKNVTTPLLLMNNKNDEAVDYTQGMEFFNLLRRLGKKAWMLQYDRGDHALSDSADVKDFAVRIMQFYDHYLKGAPAPKWMMEGIPAAKKGIDDGYELEPAGVTPGPGLYSEKQRKSKY